MQKNIFYINAKKQVNMLTIFSKFLKISSIHIYVLIAFSHIMNAQPVSFGFACDHYFEINGEKYLNGASATFCVEDLPIEVKAFHENGTEFKSPDGSDELTKWEGINSYIGNTATIIIGDLLNDNSLDVVAFYSYPSASTGITVSIAMNITITQNLVFLENSMQDYGFDPGIYYYYCFPPLNPIDEIDENTMYEAYDCGIWKSTKLEATEAPSDIFNISTVSTNPSNYVLSSTSNFVSSPNQISQQLETVSVSYEEGCDVGRIDVESINNEDCSSGYINVKAYQPLNKVIKVIVVHEQNDDEQLIPYGQGKAYTTAILAGENGILDSEVNIAGDDALGNGIIQTGMDGICNTLAQGDDIQIIPLGSGESNNIGIGLGVNEFRDTPTLGGDDFIDGIETNDNPIFPVTFPVNVGENGICETYANNSNVISSNANTTFNEYLIEQTLNDIYRQAVLSWEVIKEEDLYINFDLNRNGLLDEDSDNNFAEMRKIRESCSDCEDDEYIFLIDQVSSASFFGRFFYRDIDVEERFGIISPYNCSLQDENTLSFTFIHELGHSLGLLHPHSYFRFNEKYITADPCTDANNVMGYGPLFCSDYDISKRTLRKYQWDNIHLKFTN